MAGAAKHRPGRFVYLWIPAFAGMTVGMHNGVIPAPGTPDGAASHPPPLTVIPGIPLTVIPGIPLTVIPGIPLPPFPASPPPSFPRKRESRNPRNYGIPTMRKPGRGIRANPRHSRHPPAAIPDIPLHRHSQHPLPSFPRKRESRNPRNNGIPNLTESRPGHTRHPPPVTIIPGTPYRHSRESGNPETRTTTASLLCKSPAGAYAPNPAIPGAPLDSRFRGNDGGVCGNIGMTAGMYNDGIPA